MASSSHPSLVHDVFLNFWGQERHNFTNHLYKALYKASLTAARDDFEFGYGFRDMVTAIQRSRISVVVFTSGYAASRWCLDMLVCIMECWKTQDKLVLPVFYGVDPSDVRKHKGSYAEALEGHSTDFEIHSPIKWREALTQAANICGWDARNERSEEELICNIVKCIQSKGLPTRLNISIYPLRYDICDEYLNVFLQAGSRDVVIVGICGPSQMGKTAMARVMYDRILHNFDGGCFLADVAQTSNQPNYLVHLQQKLLSDILSERVVRISNASLGVHLIKQKLCSKRVLVVLDNVDDLRQMYALIGDRRCFGSGSKIIITARNVQLLEVFGVDQFILAQGRPLPQNVGAIWEPYQRSRCVVAGLKEYIETFNQTQERLRYLEALLLQERQKEATQARLISELLEARGQDSASTTCCMTKETMMD